MTTFIIKIVDAPEPVRGQWEARYEIHQGSEDKGADSLLVGAYSADEATAYAEVAAWLVRYQALKEERERVKGLLGKVVSP